MHRAHADFAAKAATVGVLSCEDEDVRSLRELVTYGVKGLSAYTAHANALLRYDESVDAFMQEALAKTLDETLGVDDLVALALELGRHGVDGMALLDAANTGAYGSPEVTEVSIESRSNPGILVSGHDLRDLEMLLEQTKGTGIDVCTHSEMLPANYYPALKRHDNLVGNYGNAWWRQNEEFESFNGPILMTTNYRAPARLLQGPHVHHRLCGIPRLHPHRGQRAGREGLLGADRARPHREPPTKIEEGSIVGGFAHDQVFALADQVVDAVKTGKITKFVVMAGCDGRAKSRSYYTDFARALPQSVVILTAGCAKYKYNKLGLGNVPGTGIPRVLDAGQCNDSCSLALIALKLKEVFGLDDVNDLPLAFNIAWYEQKAVIVLLALLALGVKNIHLGPTPPAFLSPSVTKVLVDNFGIAGISNVDDDLKMLVG